MNLLVSRTIPAALIAVAFLVATASTATAWSPLDGTWPHWCKTVPYAMQSAGSADLGVATSSSEVQRAFTDWTEVECANVGAKWNGMVQTAPGTYEGTSVVGWVESNWPDDPNAIGVTGPTWSGGGTPCIQEADMLLNGVNYKWTTQSGNGSNVNAYSILSHEAGHYYGLGHSNVQNATMYFAYSGGIASLQPDDKTGICALYPKGGAAADCSTTGCPAGQTCVGGTCETVVGDGSVCSVCAEDADCGGSDNYCLTYPDGGQYCGKACSNEGQCSALGEDIHCVNVGGAVPQCASFDANGQPQCTPPNMTNECKNDTDCGDGKLCDSNTGDCKPASTGGADLGGTCDASGDCNTQLCVTGTGGGVCSMTCDWLDANSCPTGFYCNANATGTCGTGLCLAGTAGAAAFGATCTVDTDCASLYCIDGTCNTPCIPNGTVECPGGTMCQASTVAGCGICEGAKTTGDACSSATDCPSRLCAEQGNRTFCTETCTAVTDCPDGYACQAAGASMICVPPAGSGGGGDNSRSTSCAMRPGTVPNSRIPWALLALGVALGLRRKRAK